jgi:acyl-CoA thioester hydrolase
MTLIPVVYELELSVSSDEIDGLGHVNNVVYLHWVQKIATAHWTEAATPEQQEQIAWVAIRHEIDYHKPAFADDRIVLRTHVGEVSGVKFERFVQIYKRSDTGDVLLAKARSLWAAIDPKTMKPKRVPAGLNEQFMRTENTPE